MKYIDFVGCMQTQIFYESWFYGNRAIVGMLRHLSPAVGAAWAMVSLEGHTLAKAAWYTWQKYRKVPSEYGLELNFNMGHQGNRPVLLLHGAVGSWNYLGDLATSLQEKGYPVFVLNVGSGMVTDAMRDDVYKKIDQIRENYFHALGTETVVDIVAHSMGGNLAVAAAFAKEGSYIDAKGDLQFETGRVKKATSSVGKVITLAMPSNREEAGWMQEIGKIEDLFNIRAKYDALMGHKECALAESHVLNIDAGHVGIVFHPKTVDAISSFL